MANAVYPNFKEHLLKGDVDLDTATLSIALIDGADYTYSATHDTYATDVPAGAKVATVALASVTTVDGLIDAADATFTAVTGDPCEILILYISSGTTYLVAYFDTGITGIPVTPNGGDIDITFNASGIVQL